MYWVAVAMPSIAPSVPADAPRICVTKIGRIGNSISVETSAKRLVKESR
jgi:hypothetical protein